MVLQILRSARNLVKYRYRFPRVSIHSSASVSPNVSLGDNSKIGSFAILSDSIIGNDVTISSKCVVNKVITENNVALYDNSNFNNCSIGSYSYIAPNASISMATIGRFCSFGPFLICGYGDHPTDFVSTSPVFFSDAKQCGDTFTSESLFDERKEIFIGNDVWIGARVFIRDGVSIGNGAIIAAGSVVVKDVPAYAIVGGVPAKLLRFRFPEMTISKLQKIKWWNWSVVILRELQPYFAQRDVGKLINWAELNAISVVDDKRT